MVPAKRNQQYRASLPSYVANVDVALRSVAALFNVYLCSLILRVVLHSEPAPSAMSALHHFGAEMLRLSRGLEASAATKPQYRGYILIGIYLYASKFQIVVATNEMEFSIDYSFGYYKFQCALICIAFLVLNVPGWICYTRF